MGIQASGGWDAVLSDYTLPEFGVVAALEIVRAADLDLPFLVVSGTVGEEIAAATMRDGANDYVLKQNLTRLAPAVSRELREADNRRARKQADEAMRASEIRYRRLFEAAQDGILIVDVLSRKILDANPFLTKLLGYSREELVGKELWEIGLFQDIEANKEAFRTLQELGYIRYHDQPLRTKDERQIEVEFVSNSYDAGDVRVIQCNIRDITDQIKGENAVRRSEERYRTLVTATAAIVWDSPASGAFDTEQPAWSAFTGQTVDQHKGWGWLNVIHPDDREKSNHAWVAAVRDRSAYQVEHRLRRADGEYRHMSVRAVPIFEPDGAIREWVGVHTDVTNQKLAEVERDELLARLQLHIERMPLAYILFDADFRITDWNPAAERIFGYTRQEALGMQPFGLVPQAFRQQAAELVARIRTGDMTANSVNDNLTKEGRTITCEWFNTPLTSEGGLFVGMLCLAQDVTARREAEAALRLRDRAIQAVTQGLLITDPCQPDNPIIFASPSVQRLTGYTFDEVIGRNCRFLQGKDTDPDAVAQMRDATQKHRACSVELLNYRKDGTAFWNNLSISPVFDSNGNATHFVGVLTDVTERRELENQFRQAQKMEAFGQLAGGVAHDFNNLLTIINGYSDIVLRGLSPDDKAHGFVTEIIKAGERSAALTSQLLAFSRKQVVVLKILDLNAVVQNTEKMLRRIIGEDIELATSFLDNIGDVRADAGQLEQVLLNLAVNARDAMPHGGKLTIETRNVELGDGYAKLHANARVGSHVLLAVSDTGCGMTEEIKTRIFEPFFTTKGVGEGTGLGLATVFGIVKQAEGHIEVYSEVNVGTSFKIYLPRINKAPEPSSGSDHSESIPHGTESILLVEDEAGLRGLLLEVLADCGYAVSVAANGAEALQVAQQHRKGFDLIVTDVVMPGMSGRQLVEQLVGRYPRVKVLYMSGYTDDAVVRHGILHEQVPYLQKPFSPFAMARKVRGVLDS